MNYYDILKIDKTATESDIKISYKALVKKYHPDLYVGDKEFAEKKIKEINEAYDVLSDSTKKAEYDAYLHELENPTPPPQASQTYYKSQSSYTQNNQNTTQDPQTNPITEFIAKKFEKLDKKVQLQIFIMILVIILTLFLINLIQVRYYLTRSDNQKTITNSTNNLPNNTTTTNSTILEDNDIFNEDTFTNSSSFDFETLDDLYNEFIKSYNEERSKYESNQDNDIFSNNPEF